MKERSESPHFEPEKPPDASSMLLAASSTASGVSTETLYHEVPLHANRVLSTNIDCETVKAIPPLKRRKTSSTRLDITTYFSVLDNKINSGEAFQEIKPYDANLEDIPLERIAALRPEFAKAQAMITQDVVQHLLNAICRLKMIKPSAALTHMEERTAKLLTPTYRPPVAIGVRGPAGAGKTSLVNCLLSKDGLAHTSSGSVGTYVPVEYLPLGQQNAPYAFEVGSFLYEESQTIIKNHWRDYYDEILSDDKESLDEADVVDLTKPAKDTFLALFADLPEFENESTADAFLGQAKTKDDAANILTNLLRWGRERYHKLTLVLKKQPFFVHTVSDLAQLMEPFVQTAVSPYYAESEEIGLESSVWPFMKIGRVALETPLLNTHSLIFADLPGTNDCNTHRVRLTENYIKKCRVTLLVYEIKRGGDKEEIRQSLQEAWRRRRGDSVILVLTHTDEIGHETSCKAPLEPEEDFQMADLKAHKANINQKLKNINTQLKNAQTKKNHELRSELTDKKERYEIHLRHVELLCKNILVEARSREVKIPLRAHFAKFTSSKEPLPIFCVSTKDYLELIRPDENRSLSQAPPEASSTQIVQLRRHLFTLVNKRGQEETMINYYRLVKHLLNEMSLACTGFKPMYERDHLLKFIRDAHESLPDQCRHRRQNFTTWIDQFIKVFDESSPEWIRKAEVKCDQWGNINANTYLTFLKREGIHKKPHGKKQNWNQTLLQYAIDDLEPPFDNLISKGCSSFAQNLMQVFRTTLEEMEHALKFNLSTSQITTFREFFENLQLLIKQIESQIVYIVRIMKQGFVKLSHETLSLTPLPSPFRNSMSHIYTSTRTSHPPKSGKPNIHAARRNAFKQAITSSTCGPYVALRTHIETGTRTLVQDAEAQVKIQCDDLFAKIGGEFDHICPVLEDEGFQALERGRELRGDIEVAKGVLEGEVKELLGSVGVVVK